MVAGRPAVVCDPGASNKAFVVAAADRVDDATMAFIVRYSSGQADVVLTRKRCGDLGWVAMSGCSLALTGRRVSVDAAEMAGTGISATDRALTARVSADPKSAFESLSRPGHVGTIAADDEVPVTDQSIVDCTLELVPTHPIRATVLAQITTTWTPPARPGPARLRRSVAGST